MSDQDVVFDPAKYRRGFSDEQIADHLRGVLAIVEELDPPMDLRPHVFGVAQAMRSSMQERYPKAHLVEGGAAMAIPRGIG